VRAVGALAMLPYTLEQLGALTMNPAFHVG
jgi:hypothetical protein